MSLVDTNVSVLVTSSVFDELALSVVTEKETVYPVVEFIVVKYVDIVVGWFVVVDENVSSLVESNDVTNVVTVDVGFIIIIFEFVITLVVSMPGSSDGFGVESVPSIVVSC